MAAGTRILTINQYGLETAHGQACAADTRLLCTAELPASDRTVVIPKAGIGKRVPKLLSAAHVPRIGVEGLRLATPEGAYYQILPLLLSSLLKGGITAAETNLGEGDYAWPFTDPLTGVETLDTFTLESGDGTAASESVEVAYCLVRELELSGNTETGECTLTATIDGDELTPTTLTTVATMPTFTAIHGKLARLYVDDTWAGLGGSELALALLDFTLHINGGGHLKRRGSATRKPGAHGQGEIEISLSLGLERSVAGVITESAKFFDSTPDKRFVRLVIDSGVIIGAGANHTLTVDLAGVWTSWHSMGRDQDGNSLDVATLEVGYDSTGEHAFDIDVITNVATI